MRKVLVVIIICSFITTPVFGQGKVGSIQKGQTAPYSGLLYDFEANAELLDRARSHRKLVEMEREVAVEKATLTCKKDLAICGIRLKKLEEKYKFRISSKDKEIAMLESKLQSEWKATTYVAGGVLIGAGLTLLVFYLTIKVDNEKN
jgi:hypothetical protein